MSDSDKYNLSNVDPDDISDVLLKVENSFDIQFKQTELEAVDTFGALCDLIERKVHGIHSEGCSTQQAYYKIREAIASVQGIDKAAITLDSPLQLLFTRDDRNRKIRRLQQQLGISFDILNMPTWFAYLISGGIVGALLSFFFLWQAAVTGLTFFITTGWLAGRFFSKKLTITTVRQLTEKLSREHYRALRRNPATINRSEITNKVKELFKADLAFEDHLLTREATFN